MTTPASLAAPRSLLSLESMPLVLVRLEGAVAFGCAVALYFHEGYGWLVLVVLALVPDVSILAYFAGPRIGAATYDAVHTYATPLALAVFGILASRHVALQLALIWAAHIGADRALGYGLKYPGGFRETHLQRL